MTLKEAITAGMEMTVHAHAWSRLPSGDIEYTDDADDADGFSTYVRVETSSDPQQPFDIVNEEDHDTLKLAQSRASALAAAVCGDRDDWEFD